MRRARERRASSFYSRLCRLRSRRRLCRRSAGAAHKRRTALRCLYGECAGTGTCRAAKIPYSAPSVPRRRRAARSGQDRPRGATTLVVCVSENIISPSHKPFRIKAAKSRPVRSGPPPRSDDVSRLREREQNPAQIKTPRKLKPANQNPTKTKPRENLPQNPLKPPARTSVLLHPEIRSALFMQD